MHAQAVRTYVGSLVGTGRATVVATFQLTPIPAVIVPTLRRRGDAAQGAGALPATRVAGHVSTVEMVVMVVVVVVREGVIAAWSVVVVVGDGGWGAVAAVVITLSQVGCLQRFGDNRDG